MRVLYLYRSSRKQQVGLAIAGSAPDTPLYGLNHLHEFGIDGKFFDSDRELGFLSRLLQHCSQRIIDKTGMGWNIGQALRSLKRQKDVDCFFATTDSTGLPLAFLKKCGVVKRPLVVASQGLSNSVDRFGWNRWFGLHKWSMSAVDRFVVYGWAERNDLCDRFGVPVEKVHWVPFGVDRQYFSRFSATPEPVSGIILAVGRDNSRDFELFLKVAASVPFRFRIITSRERLVGLEIPKNVDVRYDLTMDELCREYASCRFVVLPVRESSYSFATTTLMDALNMRKAVIVTKTRAAGDRNNGYGFEDGVHCRFVPVGCAGSLEHAVRELWNDQSLCERLGATGEAYAQQFTTRNLAAKLAGIFRELGTKY
jgi:glycosyltransferase involved in cell wall biosynthesis